jgi:hypothetical protein
LSIPGGAGEDAYYVGSSGFQTDNATNYGGDAGGGFGVGGITTDPINQQANNGVTGGNFGGGGSGGQANNVTANVAGGPGAPGIAFITEFCVQ